MYNTTAFLYEAVAGVEAPEKTGAEIHGLLTRSGLKPPGLLGDFGAGTGLISLLLAEKGWQVYGIEISEAMREVARDKAAQSPPEIQARLTFTPGDITNFTLPEGLQLDGALCLHNTVNHLAEWEQVEGFIHSAHRALKPGGVMLLDTDTLTTFKGFFHHPPTVVWDDGKHRMTRQCTFNPATGRADHIATVEIYDDTGTLQALSEEAMALQYHSESKLQAAFTEGGFKVKSAKPYNPCPQLYKGFSPKVLWMLVNT